MMRTFRDSVSAALSATFLCMSGVAQGQAASGTAVHASEPMVSLSAKTFPVTKLLPRIDLSLPATQGWTSTNAAYDLWTHGKYAQWRIGPEVASVPDDSIRAALERRSREWVTSLSARAPDVLHLDDAGRLNVAAGQDSVAQRYFAQRLALARLDPADQAYTLFAAVSSFADTAYPERLAVAERYAAMLDRLPPKPASIFIYRAHVRLAEVYDGLAQQDAALRHAFHAFGLAKRMPVLDRDSLYKDASLYLIVAHALQGQPNGAQRLDSLLKELKAASIPFPEMTPMDSSESEKFGFWEDSLARITGSVGLIGKAAPSIRAHRFWNMPGQDPESTAERALSLDDGTVRLVLFGNVNCCTDVLAAFQRLQKVLPKGASTLLVTATIGYANGMLVVPDEEVRQLKTVYLDTLHVGTPIALWVGKKQPTEWGGEVPAPSPNLQAYFVSRNARGGQDDGGGGLFGGKPYIAIVDGHGIVRQLFTAQRGFTRADQARALALLHQLAGKS
jgi:hypothetical protein